jgi:hypothetical protein
VTLRSLALVAALVATALIPSPARAGLVTQVAGNTVTTAIDLSGVTADLILTFDGAQNLSASSLGINAKLIGTTDLPGLIARLPDTSLTTIANGLPLLITVEPPALGGFSMTNTVRVEVHTHLLEYTAGSSYRLFKAPLGGAFVDITDEVAPGSVRTRGTTGAFSEFLVLVDLRSTSDVIATKFAALRSRVGDVGGSLQTTLSGHLDAAEAALAAGQYAGAIGALDDFRADVSAAAGSTLGNAWSPSAKSGNVAGDLLAGAATLRFSVGYQRDYGL